MFPDVGRGHPEMPKTFPLAKYTACFDECLGKQKAGVNEIFEKLNLGSSYPEDFEKLLLFKTFAILIENAARNKEYLKVWTPLICRKLKKVTYCL